MKGYCDDIDKLRVKAGKKCADLSRVMEMANKLNKLYNGFLDQVQSCGVVLMEKRDDDKGNSLNGQGSSDKQGKGDGSDRINSIKDKESKTGKDKKTDSLLNGSKYNSIQNRHNPESAVVGKKVEDVLLTSYLFQSNLIDEGGYRLVQQKQGKKQGIGSSALTDKNKLSKVSQNTTNSRIKEYYKNNSIEVIRNRSKQFSRLVQIGQKNVKDIKSIFDQLFLINHEKSNLKQMADKIIRQKEKLRKLKDENKYLLKENVDMKVKLKVNETVQEERKKFDTNYLLIRQDRKEELDEELQERWKDRYNKMKMNRDHINKENQSLFYSLQQTNKKVNQLEVELQHLGEEFMVLYKITHSTFDNKEMKSRAQNSYGRAQRGGYNEISWISRLSSKKRSKQSVNRSDVPLDYDQESFDQSYSKEGYKVLYSGWNETTNKEKHKKSKRPDLRVEIPISAELSEEIDYKEQVEQYIEENETDFVNTFHSAPIQRRVATVQRNDGEEQRLKQQMGIGDVFGANTLEDVDLIKKSHSDARNVFNESLGPEKPDEKVRKELVIDLSKKQKTKPQENVFEDKKESLESSYSLVEISESEDQYGSYKAEEQKQVEELKNSKEQSEHLRVETNNLPFDFYTFSNRGSEAFENF